MFYNQDWLMRQIQSIVQFVARIVFKKDSIEYIIENEDDLSQIDVLYKEIRFLLSQFKICEAEDMLIANFQAKNNEYLKLAIDFYQRLNNLSDEELEKNNFTRREIDDGIKKVIRKSEFSYLQNINELFK